MSTLELTIKGMHCNECKALITGELKQLGATNIRINIDSEAQTGIVTCQELSSREAKLVFKRLDKYKLV